MRASLRRYGAGAALLLSGAVLGGWSQLAGPGPRPAAVGPDGPVNRGGGDQGDISAHNSPTIARNPRDADHLVVTSRIDSPDFSCAVHVSTDGGASWSAIAVPIPKGAGTKCYAPDAAFGPDGTLYVSYVTLQGAANRPRAAWLASSRDGGRTLSAPRRVSGPLAFQVRLAADPAVARRLYMTWVQARDTGNLKFVAPGNPILVSRSDDGGATWGRPVGVNDPRRGRVLAPSSAVGAAGELYVLFLDVGEDRLDYEGGHEGFGGPPYPGRFALVLARSRDRGATWQESVIDDGIVPIGRFIAFLPPFPSLAIDRAGGRIYAAFHDARRGTPDVWVWSLAAGDRAWSKPVRVNDTPPRDATAQYLPKLAVTPQGRLDVVYYDRRGDPRANRRNRVSLQSSEDGGRTFGAHVALSSRSFDSRIGLGSERGLPDLGSRLGLVSDEREAFAVWSDTRAGSDASGKQDIVGARVSATPAGANDELRSVGIALAAGGICALLIAARRRGTSGAAH